jgi:hypothetical protein
LVAPHAFSYIASSASLRPVIETPWYDEPIVIGLSAVNLGLAVVVALASYLAMSVALRLAAAQRHGSPATVRCTGQARQQAPSARS